MEKLRGKVAALAVAASDPALKSALQAFATEFDAQAAEVVKVIGSADELKRYLAGVKRVEAWPSKCQGLTALRDRVGALPAADAVRSWH